MRALIIGAAGFVGGYLIDHLQAVGMYDVCATKMASEAIDKPHVRVYDLNILHQEEISSILEQERPDYIFHLAAQSSVAESWKNPALTIDVNVKGAVNVLEAIRNMDDQSRVLLIGSGEEYGLIQADECPVREETPLRPGNIYAATKACQNMLGSIYAKAYGMEIILARAFNHIGPGQSPAFVVADFCRQVAEIEAGKREPVIRVGNLTAQRDFTDVRDIVRAYWMLMQKGIPGTTYNVGSGQAISIDALLHKILSLSSAQIEVQVEATRLRPVDVPIITADITRLQRDTGWQRVYAISETLKDTLQYWRLSVS